MFAFSVLLFASAPTKLAFQVRLTSPTLGVLNDKQNITVSLTESTTDDEGVVTVAVIWTDFLEITKGS